MAMATSTIVALALAAAAAGTSYYNTQQTAKRQDNALATSLTNQAKKQREADAKVNAEVEKVKASTAEDERRQAFSQYMDTLARGKQKADAGLEGQIGGAAFQSDAAAAKDAVAQYGAKNADLMARIDAPGLQRQGEAFGYGHLGTDLDLIGREAKGQAFLDELRLRAVRRNAGLDALSSFLGGAASGAASGGFSGGGQEFQISKATLGPGATYSPTTYGITPITKVAY